MPSRLFSVCDDHTYHTVQYIYKSSIIVARRVLVTYFFFMEILQRRFSAQKSISNHFPTEDGVCVCFLPIHSEFSSSLDVPAGVTQEEGHTGFFIHLLSAVRALIFFARRIQPFLSLVDREVEFCVLTI